MEKKDKKDKDKHDKHKHDKHDKHKHDKHEKNSKHKHDKHDKHDKQSKHKHDKHDRKHKDDKDKSNTDKHINNNTMNIIITEDDYYNKSEEFRVWLKLCRDGLFFEDLTTVEAKDLFQKFSKAFNKGRLPPMYYDGNIPLAVRGSIVKSKHKWDFKLNSSENIQLSDVIEDVDRSTRTGGVAVLDNISHGMTTGRKLDNQAIAEKAQLSTSSVSGIRSLAAPRGVSNLPAWMTMTMTEQTAATDNRSSVGMSNAAERYNSGRTTELKNINRKETHAVLMAEHLPDKALAGSHEHRIDKKRSIGDMLHGAHRYNEEERDGLTMSESVIMGGDSVNEYKQLAERSKMHRERHQDRASSRAM